MQAFAHDLLPRSQFTRLAAALYPSHCPMRTRRLTQRLGVIMRKVASSLQFPETLKMQ